MNDDFEAAAKLHALRVEKFTRLTNEAFGLMTMAADMTAQGIELSVDEAWMPVYDKIGPVLHDSKETLAFVIFAIGCMGAEFAKHASDEGFDLDAYKDDDERTFVTTSGQTLINVHPKSACHPPCVIHAPLPGPWDTEEGWKTYWFEDRKHFYRVCPHKRTHLAPENFDIGTMDIMANSIGCDGCCQVQGCP